MIDLHFPPTTLVGKPVPKNAFYKHLDVNTRIKQHFVDDIASIHWLYKLAPSTLNAADGIQVHEIVLFLVTLKALDCPNDVFRFIDEQMPRHVLFILEYEAQCKLLLNYKEWREGATGSFQIVKTFSTEWIPPEQLQLTLSGQNMDALYESMAGEVSGFGTSNAEETRHLIALQEELSRKQKLLEALQKRIRAEKQFARQVEMNSETRTLKRDIARLKAELNQ